VTRSEYGGIFFRLLFFLFFLGFLAVIYVARFPLMRYAAQFWVLDEPVAPSDAVIVLGDDNYAADRAFHAAELYRQGVAPVVVASGRMLRKDVSLADVMQHDLETFGVPTAAVVKLAHRAQNTREEAAQAAQLIKARGWKRIVVVTSNYHARRARFIFENTLPPGVTLRVSAARDSEFDPSHWWETRQGQKLFFSELAGYVVARWELRDSATSEHETALGIPYPIFGQRETLKMRNRALFYPPPVSDWKHSAFAGFALCLVA
jgi:vancomycin permeability regulator SanA